MFSSLNTFDKLKSYLNFTNFKTELNIESVIWIKHHCYRDFVQDFPFTCMVYH